MRKIKIVGFCGSTVIQYCCLPVEFQFDFQWCSAFHVVTNISQKYFRFKKNALVLSLWLVNRNVAYKIVSRQLTTPTKNVHQTFHRFGLTRLFGTLSSRHLQRCRRQSLSTRIWTRSSICLCSRSWCSNLGKNMLHFRSWKMASVQMQPRLSHVWR